MTQNSINPFAVWIGKTHFEKLSKILAQKEKKHAELMQREYLQCIDREHEIAALKEKLNYVAPPPPVSQD